MIVGLAASFFPTSLGGWAAVIAVIVGAFNFKNIRQVHVLVNGRLTKALEDISALKEHTDLPQRRADDGINEVAPVTGNNEVAPVVGNRDA